CSHFTTTIYTKGKDLVRSGMTHFTTFYLTLGCLNDNKDSLIECFFLINGLLVNVLKRGGDLLERCPPSSSCALYGGFRRKEKIRDAFQGVEI
ncbi:hypothetical protein S245_052346, partial [Arachis hypogaea]